TAPPLIIAIPGRRLADLARILMDGGVDIGRTGRDAGRQHRHVHERRTHIDDDLRTGVADHLRGGRHVQRIQRMRLEPASSDLQRVFLAYRINDAPRLLHRARGNVDVAKHIIVPRTLVGHDLGYAAGTNDEDVLFHSRDDLLRFTNPTTL